MNHRALLVPLLALAGLASGMAAAAPPAGMKAASAGPVQLNCDMLAFSGQLDKATERELGPAHTLDAAAAILNRHNVVFTRSRGTLSFGEMPQKMLDQINKLPPGEPVVLPNQGGGAICVLVPGGDTY